MARPTIEVADHAGVCYGVERALDLAYGAVEAAPKPVHTLGPLIHNPIVVDELAEGGIAPIDDLEGTSSGSVIIRAHGVVPSVIDDARRRGLNVIDATCPYVKRVHKAAEKLVREGYQLVVVGESGHPEVEGIMGHADDAAITVSCVDDLPAVELQRRVGVVVQTTQTVATLSAIVDELLVRTDEVRVINTICSATQERQEAASDLAGRVDVMVVIGGKNSGNTRRLVEICHERCDRTYHIEDASELSSKMFSDASCIGITAGASTPASHIQRAVLAIESLTGACA